MASPKAPVLSAGGKAGKDVALEEAVFAADVKPHLVHETVRAELNAQRSGTRAAKSRGLVSGGRAKPWRQKGTGRARAGTTRAPQFTGGGLAFPPSPRTFDVKVNRKARRSALRSALSDHASRGTIGLIDGSSFDAPSTKAGAEVVASWGKELPLLIVATEAEENLILSFRNLERVMILTPSELEVAPVVWARSLLITQSALDEVQGRAA